MQSPFSSLHFVSLVPFAKMNFTSRILYLLLFLFLGSQVQAQCPQIIGGDGLPSNNPRWVSCSGGAFNLFIQGNQAIGSYIISWGDGTANNTGASIGAAGFVSHNYAAAQANYTVTITETSTGCVISGTVIMEEAVNSAIQIPLGGVTAVCAPGTMSFTNASTNVSSNTNFIWTFGDGSAPVPFNSTNAGAIVSHTFQRNTVNCVTTVTLSAENFCSFGTPTVASFNPIQVYDIDDAQITASATALCYPDTTVTLTNTTAKNCLPQGNNIQRYEYWNFGDHWGMGTDSIVNWQPFDPPARIGYTLEYPGKGTYQVMLIDSNQCGQDTAYQTIVIGDPPTANFTKSRDTICAGEAVILDNTTTVGANAYAWNYGDGTGWQNTGAGNQTKIFNTPGTYTITLVANITGGSVSCTDTIQYPMEVLQNPTSTFTVNPNSGCDSLLVTFTNSSANAASWLWNYDNGATDTIQNPGVINYNIVGSYNPQLIVTHVNGCKDTSSASVNVYSTPDVDFIPKNVCQNLVAQFIDSSKTTDGNPVNNWVWDFGDGTGSMQQNPNHLYSNFGNFTITLTASTAFCTGVDSFTVTAETKPIAAFSMSDSIGCAPLAVTFSDSSIAGTISNWDFGDGSTSLLTNPAHSFLNNGLNDTFYIVTLISETTFGCSDTISDSVIVYKPPTSLYTSNHSPGCGPIDVSFTNSSVNAVSYFWDFGDTSTSAAPNPSHTYENKTLFIEIYDTKLIAIAANGCTDTSSRDITVYPEPIFTFTANPDSGCSPLRVTFPSVIGAVTYAWDFDDGSSGAGPTPTHTFGNGTTNNVNYNVRLIARSSFGCIDTNYQNVIVHPNPIADFTLSDSVGCQPLPISITNNSSGAINYFWDFGNGDTSMSSANVFNYSYSHPMPNPTNNNLRLIVETDRQCRDTLEQNVIVYPEVTANFIKSDSAGCSPLRVNFTNLSNNAQNFSWDFQDGSTSAAQNPIHTFINSGTTSQLRDVLLVSSSVYSCVDSSSKVIVINPLPVADFSLSDTASCQPLVESITNNTTGAIKYEWFYGNGDTSNTSNSNFNYTYTHFSIVPVNYNFRLIATTNLGCKDTASQNIRVFPQILTNFLTSDTIGCTPLTTRFTNFSTGSQFFNWDFGDGNSSVNGTVSHTYQNTSTVNRTYTAELVTSSVYGCTDTARQNIVVHPKPISSFNPSTLSGCQPLTVDFNNNSVIATQNFWEFGDGSSSTSAAALVSHTYSNTGTSSQFRNVRLIVVSQFGCEDTSFQTIEVYPLVESNFDINDTSGCHPFTANFTSLSTNAQLYAWDFGDGASDVIANPTHIYQNTTTANVSYTVSLIVTSPEGCPDTVDQQITVYPQPVAAFTATPVNQKFPNATVSFNNLSNPGTWSYDWEFGDGATETLQVPNDYTYQTWGTFTLTLVVRSANCSDTAQQIVVIDPPRAVVAFVGNGKGCKPLTVEFENQSEYGQSYIWNFGDGGISTLETPGPYTYYNAGTYSINLSVLGPDGDLVTMVKVDSVVVHEVSEAYFDLAPSEVVVPTQPVNFYNLSQNADQYVWDFGDGTTSTEEDPEHYYQEPGWYTVRLLTDNEFGCPDSFVIDEAVFADNKGSIEFPTAFIPDPSGPNGGSYDPNSFRNDIFFPVFEGVIEYHLMIFNRWGEIIFETKEIGRGWDGYHQLTGQILQQDVYVWRANVTFANQQTQELAGEVTLLR